MAAGEHLPAEEVAVRVRGALGPTSTQTVYDALAALLGVGLLRRIEPADSPMLYERRVGDNHHHLICRACRRVQDVDCLVGAKPCLTPDDDHGYILDEAEVTFWGLCPSCQAAAAARPTP
ncbi:MAG: transcriptional repressor [Propionibacteriaceae bacterium]|nr:transcriptional repressor [Propionibacteriaceae bacterium]